MSVFYNRAKSNKGLPIGSIIPWSGPSEQIPRGWITCNGNATYKVADYPVLYKILGNVYGGASGQTFKLPRLNDGTSAAMDIYKGHFYYLQDKGDAHKPENTNISVDIFWQTVGGSLEGNTTSTTQTNWVSSIDVVGVLNNIENLSAKYGDITYNPGDFTQTLVPAGRRLSDVHVPNHIHGITNGGTTAFGLGGGQADTCNGGSWTEGSCTISTSCACINRVVLTNINGRTMANQTDPPNEANYFNTFNAMLVNQGYPIESLRWGGGGFSACFGGETSSTCYNPLNSADGYTGGDMFSHNGTRRYFWSGLSPSSIVNAPWSEAASNTIRQFARVTDHGHGTLDVTFSSKYIRVIKPALVNDVRLNTVRINNETGVNFGFINVNTATPTLSMQYIIKAF
jgi:microcystin-dependent protein